MNMMTAIQARASGATIATALHQLDHAGSAWSAALADFNLKRDFERSLPIDDSMGDDAVEAMCIAMDHLIEEVPAPDLDALKLKLQLAHERAAAFETLFGDHRNAILADMRRLAGESDEAIAATSPRDSHALCEDERQIFVDLPDLRTGRTLEDALKELDGIATIDPASYPAEWVAEVRDIGCSVSANYPKDGPRHLYTGFPCDGQMDERKERMEALNDHMHAIDGMYERVADFMERRGHYTDNRAKDTRETTAALRDFLAAGFRVFLHPDGRVGTSGGMPREWVKAPPARAAEIEQAARRFDRARRRHRNEPQIKRAIRMLGTVESNGFIVLTREER